MKPYYKAAILGCLTAGAGVAAYRCRMIRMSLKEFPR